MAGRFSKLRGRTAFKTLVLLNAQTMTDTDLILAASLCNFDKVILTGRKTAGVTSCLHRLTGEPEVAVNQTTTRRKGKSTTKTRT